MDIYLTDLETNDCMRFPMLPEEITVNSSASFYTYSIINVGEIKIPSGEMLTGFSWSGKLPGAARKNEPYVKAWIDPREVQSRWSVFRNKKTKLRLLVTETPINHNVYIASYSVNYAGGYGDYDYTIEFIQAKELKIYAAETQTTEIIESGDKDGSGDDGNGRRLLNSKRRKVFLSSPDGSKVWENSGYFPSRTAPPAPKTYTVAVGDSLWSIAEKLMGGGSKYLQLYMANREIIDEGNKNNPAEKYMIYAGQILTIPR